MTKSILGATLSAIAFAVASCGNSASGDTSSSAASTPSTADGDERPFAIAEHGTFDEPWALAVEPGTGNIFITEKAGTAKFFQPANGRLGFIESGLPEVAYGGQGGLGDFAFAPDYPATGTVYLSWADKAGSGNKRRAVVGRGKLVCEEHDSCRIDGLSEIWQQSVAVASKGHFSHRITFSPDGRYLFVASGDRIQQDPAQDLSNNLGTVVRLNLDGSAAAGNPFSGRGSPTDEIWSYGHRNTLGLAFDPDGQLFNLEHGPAGGDELNRIEPGKNYGWPDRSFGDNYNGTNIPEHTANDGFTKPLISWTPVIAPGDMIFYSGPMFPEWRGQALIANLKTKSISRVSFAEDKKSAKEEARYSFPRRLRSIAQGHDGAIWVIEDRKNARLMKLTKAK